MNLARRRFVALIGSLTATASVSSLAMAAKPAGLSEPVHRVATASPAVPADLLKAKPLDHALDIARRGLQNCQAQVDDYTTMMVIRERVGGQLGAHQYIAAKIRNRKIENGKIVQPLSVYLNFLKPSTIKGREVIYVEGANNGNIIAHEGGFKGRYLPTVRVKPDSMLAMRGQRYPMTEIGVENLIEKLIQRGEKAKTYPDAQCDLRQNARVKDRVCTVFQLTQPTKRPGSEFHKAQIFIDDAYNVPIRYIAYDWPRVANAKPEIIEEYNYMNLKINVGLKDSDFDPENPKYNF
ncbi:DUF1571 domain-containing protein [Planctomycetes bacterium K23_9]|uniref:DUF1571 domain-containing protein n=1 Tax=Stieleria marina TaxID=1930275 RepID=A0A517NX57_9BACT|nr:hypothetical protein K239x_37150 [Planctomycetes bacterium K23_9]